MVKRNQMKPGFIGAVEIGVYKEEEAVVGNPRKPR